jgi:stress-induced morphogen
VVEVALNKPEVFLLGIHTRRGNARDLGNPLPGFDHAGEGTHGTYENDDEDQSDEHEAQIGGPDASLEPPATINPMDLTPLRSLLERAFPDATELSVEDRTGGGDHLQVTVATPRFAGLSLLDQHRLVNDALAEPLRDGTIHELRIKTKGSE